MTALSTASTSIRILTGGKVQSLAWLDLIMRSGACLNSVFYAAICAFRPTSRLLEIDSRLQGCRPPSFFFTENPARSERNHARICSTYTDISCLLRATAPPSFRSRFPYIGPSWPPILIFSTSQTCQFEYETLVLFLFSIRSLVN